MKIARYWTRAPGDAVNSQGGRIRVTARGWSDESIDSARVRAREIARRMAERVAAQPGSAPRYPYGDRPLPEPILSEFSEGAGQSAVITRNSYGALVMNTAQMMFVDIDRQDSHASQTKIKNLFSSLFGKSTSTSVKVLDPVIEAVRTVAEHRRLSGHIYRTAGGYRVLITSHRFPVKSADTEALLNEFRADPLYVRLCRMQESFRARLTPKPWRLGMRKPPVDYPFETPADQMRFSEWERVYESKAAGYSTCAYQTAFGSNGVLPEFDALIRFHDEKTKSANRLPLA